DRNIPLTAHVGGRPGGARRAYFRRVRESAVKSVADDGGVAGLHLPGHHRNGTLAAFAPGTASAGQHDARIAVVEPLLDFLAVNAEGVAIRRRLEARRAVGQASRLAHFGGDAVDAADGLGGLFEPALPAPPFGFVVALDPHLDRRQHPHGFLFADLHRTA